MAAPTITSIGTRTTQITLNKSTFVQLKDAVKNAMTGLTLASSDTFSNGGTTGWDLIDEYRYGIGMSIGASPKLYQVFRSKNKDGVTYKNIIFCWNQVDNVLDIRTCERWGTSAAYNAETNTAITDHSITNEAWSYYDAASIGYKLDACDFLINVGPRWALAHSYINSEPSEWAGVFEIARNDPSDVAVASNPCWGMITSITLFQHYDVDVNGANRTNGDYPIIAMPSVMKNGTRVTGIAACTDFSINTGLLVYPTTDYVASGKSFAYLCSNSFSILKNNGWDTTKRLCMPISLIAGQSTAAPTPLGQVYGMKMLYPTGNNMNRIKLYIDADGNFSTTGTNQDHFLLMNHGPIMTTASITDTHSTKSALGALGSNPEFGQIHSVGSAYFVCMANAGTKVKRVDAFTGSTIDVLTFSGGYLYSKYDGENYLYIGTGTTIYKLNVWTLNVSSTTVHGGARAFGINADYVYFELGATLSSMGRLQGGTGSTNDDIPTTKTTLTISGSTYTTWVWATSMDFDSYGNMFYTTCYTQTQGQGYTEGIRRLANVATTATETMSANRRGPQFPLFILGSSLKVISDTFIMVHDFVCSADGQRSTNLYPASGYYWDYSILTPSPNWTIASLAWKATGSASTVATVFATGYATDIMKINGCVVSVAKGWNASPYTFAISSHKLQNDRTSNNVVIGSPNVSGSIASGFGGKLNSAAKGRSACYDGARLILAGVESPYDANLCVYSGLHNANQINTVQCLQMAIPA
jgi:hypothetical protein